MKFLKENSKYSLENKCTCGFLYHTDIFYSVYLAIRFLYCIVYLWETALKIKIILSIFQTRNKEKKRITFIHTHCTKFCSMFHQNMVKTWSKSCLHEMVKHSTNIWYKVSPYFNYWNWFYHGMVKPRTKHR